MDKLYPRFVGGGQRSGTGILATILSRHEYIYLIPVEMQLDTVLKNAAAVGIEKGEIVNRLFHRLATGKNFVLDERSISKYWLDKSPNYGEQRGWEELQKMFPYFKLLLIVRDLRDTVCSFMRRGAKKYGWELNCKNRFIHQRESFKAAALFGPERCKVVHFEDLFFNKEKMLKAACSFFDLPWQRDLMSVPLDKERAFQCYKKEMPEAIQEWCLKKYPKAYYYKG